MARKDERLRRDMAGIGPEPRRAGLHPLRALKDFTIGKGEPDIRGWEVRTLSGRDIGKVDDLLVDPDAGEVVMMDVAMRGSDRHVELPLRNAQLDHHTRHVVVDSGDVDLYAGGNAAAATYDDVRERDARETFVEREREAREDEVNAQTRLRGRDADAIERDAAGSEARSDVDEVVVERRPVIEEVVIRRKVIDND